MANKHFDTLLQKMKETHDKKSHDYAQDSDPFSNFRYAAQVSDDFKGVHRVFATLIAVKLARLAQLHGGKQPNNESTEDSHLDLANYATIWGSYTMSEAEKRIHPFDCAHTEIVDHVCARCGVHENIFRAML